MIVEKHYFGSSILIYSHVFALLNALLDYCLLKLLYSEPKNSRFFTLLCLKMCLHMVRRWIRGIFGRSWLRVFFSSFIVDSKSIIQKLRWCTPFVPWILNPELWSLYCRADTIDEACKAVSIYLTWSREVVMKSIFGTREVIFPGKCFLIFGCRVNIFPEKQLIKDW